MTTEDVKPDVAGRRRSGVVKVGAIFVLGAIVGVLGLMFLRPDNRKPDAERTLAPAAPNLTGTAAELASLVGKSRSGTYHALYRVAGDQSRGSVEIEVWRKDGLIKQEEAITSQGKTVRTAAYQLEDRTVICSRPDEAAWQCGPAPATADGARTDLLAQVTEQLDGKSVEASGSKRILGLRASCYKIVTPGAKVASEICLTSEGTPLLLKAGPARLEIVSLETKVDSDVFIPPAGSATRDG